MPNVRVTDTVDQLVLAIKKSFRAQPEWNDEKSKILNSDLFLMLPDGSKIDLQNDNQTL